MSKTIATENAPAAIGPYVQGVDLGSMVITSGQIPVDPKTGAVAEDVSAQARQSLENVKAIVEAAGLKVGDIVKTTVFVKDLNDFRDRQRHLRSLLHRAQRHLPGAFPAWKLPVCRKT
ncbi:Endoribonuclease L-PSP [Salmonella enterica subsp. enterica]|uniref:Endoribonuclease L-PSP n=1 Tax=Salmonella enterica I TaxID=59201 RepID=A0A447TNU8_SALET|nr:Endoribonuclease L-PSP [Salmonella enterica subsp. enterica]